MKLIDDQRTAIDLSTTPLHLGLGSRARPIDGFAFDPAVLDASGEAVAALGGPRACRSAGCHGGDQPR